MNPKAQIIADLLKRSDTAQSMENINRYMRSMGFYSDNFYSYTKALVKEGLVNEVSEKGKKAYLFNASSGEEVSKENAIKDSIDVLKLPNSLKIQLRKNCIFTIKRLVAFEEEELLELPGIAKTKIVKIKEALGRQGLKLKEIVREIKVISPKILNQGVGQLDLPKKIVERLEREKIFMVKQLLAKDKKGLVSSEGITERTCEIIEKNLSGRGLALGMEYHYEETMSESTTLEPRSISALELPEYVIERLKNNGIYTLRQLTDVTREEMLLFFKDILPAKVDLIEGELKENDLTFKEVVVNIGEDEIFHSASVEQLGIPLFICESLEEAHIKSVGELLMCDEVRLFKALGMSKKKLMAVKEGIKRAQDLPLKIRNPQKYNEAKKTSYQLVSTLNLSERSLNCLEEAKIRTIGDLIQKKEIELLRIKNFGQGSLTEIKELLAAKDLSLGMVYTQNEPHFTTTFPLFTNQKQSKKNKQFQELEVPLESLGIDFSVRAENVLNNMAIYTLADLLFVTKKEILEQQNSGKKTVEEIFSKIYNYLESNPQIKDITSSEKGAEDTATEEEYIQFPLFQGTMWWYKPEDVKDLDLEKIQISPDGFTEGIVNIFKQKNIRTLNDLLNLSSEFLLKQKSMGKKRIDAVQTLGKDIIEGLIESNGRVYDSIEDCLECIRDVLLDQDGIKKDVLKERNAKMIELRYGFDGKKRTLLEVANQTKVTRERVRQIESAALTKLYNKLPYLAQRGIEDFITKIKYNDGILGFDQERIDKDAAEFQVFNALLRSKEKKLKYYDDTDVWAIEDHYESAYGEVYKFLEKKCSTGEMLDDMELHKVAEQCASSIKLARNDITPLLVIFKRKYFKYYGNKYFYKKVGDLALIEDLILRHFPKGVNIYKDVDSILKKAKKNKVTHFEEYSERRFSGIVQRSPQLMLWGRGIYIHRDNTNVDTKILTKTDMWIYERLVKKGLERVSVWGAFNEMEKECKEAGIPNEHALYSCLRERLSNKYYFAKDPHVFSLKSTKKKKRRNPVEEYLLSKKGSVSESEISEDLGLKNFQICQWIGMTDKVISLWNKKHLHINNINYSLRDMANIMKQLKEEVEQHQHISIKQIFQDNIAICKKNGIDSGIVLYAVLRLNYPDELFFPRHPYVLEKDHGIEDDGCFSLNDIMNHFFESHNRIIPQHEINSYFVKKRGYRPGTISNIRYLCDNIVKYNQTALVSLDTLKWSEKKEKMLEQEAIELFNKNCTTGVLSSSVEDSVASILAGTGVGVPFTLIDELLEKSLPNIGNGTKIKWTRILLSELLERIESIRVLGSMRSIYISCPNKFEVENIEDIICYILQKEFGGTANVDKFLKRLKDLSITGTLDIKRSSNEPEKFKIKNNEVKVC